MKTVLLTSLLLLSICAFGCASMRTQNAEAEESTINTVGAEWHTYYTNDENLSDEQKARRDRKWFSWKYRVGAALKKDIQEPGAPTEKELAESTRADLDLLGGE